MRLGGGGGAGGGAGPRLERTVPQCHTVGLYRRNVGHPPALPVYLTLNLAAGMRRRVVCRGGVRQTETVLQP